MQCQNCDHGFEVKQSIHDRPKKKCPECKKMKLFRVVQPCGMVFVGSGFHCNDYGRKA
jgi:putative FmdB family regulatory protein